mmetsp:Transcript_84989/g.168700  ORF Transcript_84989/g.168700 Transcript_84989/m.168700 type:complete len:192 (+) Transcript_84989:13-588(+)
MRGLHSLAALEVCCFLMAVAALLTFLQGRIEAGCAAHISLSETWQAKTKIKTILDPAQAPTSPHARGLLLAMLKTACAAEHSSLTVDRGYRHSSGKTETCFWMTATAMMETEAEASKDEVAQEPCSSMEPMSTPSAKPQEPMLVDKEEDIHGRSSRGTTSEADGDSGGAGRGRRRPVAEVIKVWRMGNTCC